MNEKRTIRPAEVRVAEIDKKIAKYETTIAKLRKNRERILNPVAKKTRVGMSTAIRSAKEAGITPEELLDMIKTASSKK